MLMGLVGTVSLMGAAGCRTSMQKTHVPRVDLQLEGVGNRGYLVGAPPPVVNQKVTREMVDITIEIPAFARALQGGRPAPATEAVQVATSLAEEEVPELSADAEPAPQDDLDTYTVQKGDSLWTIAARPEIYGNATQWRRLLDANRDQLANPNALKAGMVLKVPREGVVVGRSGEDGAYRK
jgi:LysM repeat protein